jgi:integrase/recombinase XerD
MANSSNVHSPIQTRVAEPRLRQLLGHLATERGLAQNSLHAYRRDLENLSDFLSERNRNLKTADVRDYREYLHSQSRGGKSTRTVARRLAAIRVMLRFFSGEDRKSIKILQQLDRPKPEKSLPKILSRTQVNQLIAAPNPKSKLFFRDVAILELLYASGLRASELCSLKLRDLNPSVGVIRVMGKGSKERIVPVGHAAIEAIERYLAECRPKLARDNDDHLFLSRSGKPFDRISLWMLVEKYGRASGLLKQVSPHTLRHCFATHLISGGADLRIVQELLGHSDISTTQIYTHVDQDRLKAVHRKFHPRK